MLSHSFTALQLFLLPEKLFSTLSSPRTIIQRSLSSAFPAIAPYAVHTYMTDTHVRAFICLYLAPKLDRENWNHFLRIPSAWHSASSLKSVVASSRFRKIPAKGEPHSDSRRLALRPCQGLTPALPTISQGRASMPTAGPSAGVPGGVPWSIFKLPTAEEGRERGGARRGLGQGLLKSPRA